MTDKKLKGFIAQRDNAVDRLQDIKNMANEAAIDNKKHSQFKASYKHVQSIISDFDTQHAGILNILATMEDSDMDEQRSIRRKFDNIYYEIESIYTDLFENKANIQVASPSHVKLPKLELKKFDGSIRNWKTFIDLFDSMIHKNSSLTGVEKFTYLLNSLEGTPLSIVQCNPLTDGNYIIAYNALKGRYENSRLIAVSHWREIEKTKKINSDLDVKALHSLLDTFTEHLSALEHIGHPIAEWDFILFYMLFDRLDSSTATRFELECGNSLEDPNNKHKQYEILLNFLKKQCVALDTVSHSYSSKFADKDKLSKPPKRTSLLNSNPSTCPACKKTGHLIYSCPEFLQKNAVERYDFIKSNKWCTNCLGVKHTNTRCSSRMRCAKCSKSHHSLLHRDAPALSPPAISSPPTVKPDAETQSVALSNMTRHNGSEDNLILLSTAQIRVLDSRGCFQQVRVLLDSGSQINFVTTKCCNRLGLPKRSLSLSVKGLENITAKVTQEVTCTFIPKLNVEPRITLDFAVISRICDNMPTADLPENNFKKFSHLTLADDKFNISSPVDMLLGCDVFGFLFKEGIISHSIEEPVALNTYLGWIIMGRVPLPKFISSKNSLCTTISSSLDDDVRKFWQLEQVPQVLSLSPEEVAAEELFSLTHTRANDGRYIVNLPFKASKMPEFTNTRDIALRRFYSLERRLVGNSPLYNDYCNFMRDYLDSGHMELVSPMLNSSSQYYIPHHCVVRPESSTTKLRVVFDASTKASNNLSLNDTLLVGPKLQQDIFLLLLRFRHYPVVFTADIKQMFRQINIFNPHRDFQRIIWRFSKSEPIRDYRLTTVTFGLSSSPFQAIRVLVQLARDYESQFPLAAKVLQHDTYVDDIISGAPDLKSALLLQKELIELLSLGGFELRKWASNTPSLVSHFDKTLTQVNPLSFDKESEATIKILGLQWNPSHDSFSYNIDSKHTKCTKRNLLSDLARIFDPLGFLTPITVLIKLFIQQLWSSGLDWDEPAPSSISNTWSSFKQDLSVLSSFALPRKIVPQDMKFCELHGFCDSSESAYAAVIYLRTVSKNEVNTSFLCARSRVAPLKKISVPRLELCAAVLLADLIFAVKAAFKDILNITEIYAWSDSTVALSWIRSSPHKWATFVSNRVTHIQEKLSPGFWHHVSSEENSADCATRGLQPSELIRMEKWWAGPHFLISHYEPWSTQCIENKINADVTLERRKITLTTVAPMVNFWDTLIEKFSSLTKINRVFAYLARFIHNARNPHNRLTDSLSFNELDKALLILIKNIQAVFFAKEISELSKTSSNFKSLPKYFRKLSPFLDQEGVLRVGGRLTHSSLSYDHKYPCLLPSDHRLTRLIIEYTHNKYLHPGLQTTQYLLSQRYWIPSSKRTIKKVLSSCLRCFKCNPSSSTPLMGNLPPMRVNKIKCFTKCGVDFGGPFLVTMGKVRGAKSYKAYICLFVCLATKALHLELATELSSDAFLAALRRFISRRGLVTDIYSDCGTNFVGASKQLLQNMRNASSTEGIRWHFNPPSAPNFGGIWEAGIKSVKKHISRVIGTHILTYEEFNTVLVSIEAVLNSRPLCPISSDPNDLTVLTPSHFLNLQPLNSFIEPDLTDIKLGRLSRWQLLQRMHQDFWKRWQAEYLHTLNQRSKWYDSTTAIKNDTLVLLKDELSPPLRWHLGRVVDSHPGADGITRVVTVKTQSGFFKRPVSKVCPLPNC